MASPKIRSSAAAHRRRDPGVLDQGDLARAIPIMMGTIEPADEWEERLAAHCRLLWAAMLRTWSFFKPVVAAVRGRVFAGGLELMLATDLRVASSDATFALTEVHRGLIAGGGSLARLPRQLAWAGCRASWPGLTPWGSPWSASRSTPHTRCESVSSTVSSRRRRFRQPRRSWWRRSAGRLRSRCRSPRRDAAR
jgi:hypothetical protein